MIHAVYVKYTTKGLWYLTSTSVSAAVAQLDQKQFLKEAIKKGRLETEAAIKTFETTWFLPETLTEIKDDSRLLWN